MTAWYETAFDADYLRRYPHRDDAEAAADIAALTGWIRPSRDLGVLDLGCGGGRHLLALCRAGFTDLTGIDLSADLLERARTRLSEAGCEVAELLRADMRELPYSDRFATALSLFTSFGYFSDDAEDERVLRGVWRALKPRGVFLLDTLARQHTIDTLVEKEERRFDDRLDHIERRITDDGRRVEKTVRIRTGDAEERSITESVRMYEPDELEGAMKRAGFSAIQVAGALDGRAFRADSRRLVVVGCKETT